MLTEEVFRGTDQNTALAFLINEHYIHLKAQKIDFTLCRLFKWVASAAHGGGDNRRKLPNGSEKKKL